MLAEATRIALAFFVGLVTGAFSVGWALVGIQINNLHRQVRDLHEHLKRMVPGPEETEEGVRS